MTELFPKLGGKHRVPDSGILMELKGDTAPVNEVDVHCVVGSDLGPKAGLAVHKVNSYFLELPEYMAGSVQISAMLVRLSLAPTTGLRHHMGAEDLGYEEEKCCCSSLNVAKD